jgi:two-component system cell cycle response regulator DivK
MLNVLYVEDDPGSRQVMTIVERSYPGYMRPVVLPDSSNFEQYLLHMNPSPDVILLDIHVKPLTGFEMFHIIRSHAQFDHVPVMALTASVMNEEVVLLQQTGFQGVLSKPLDIDAFPGVVDRVMGGESVWYVW